MRSMRQSILWFVISLFLPLAASAEDDVAARAQALLQKSVAYYKTEGEKALAAFSRQGPFVQDDLYVYVLNANGVMLASGGPSVMLIGRDVLSHLDPELRARFSSVLENAEQGVTYQGEYSWLSWDTQGAAQPKEVFYQRYEDKLFGVGFYSPKDDSVQAHLLLDRAIDAVSESPYATFNAINSLSPDFYQDDLYVFVVDSSSGRVVAHGSDLRNVGRDFKLLPGADGEAVGQEILRKAEKSRDLIEFDYRWKNPVTGRNEVKRAFAKRDAGYLIVVGYYRANAQ